MKLCAWGGRTYNWVLGLTRNVFSRYAKQRITMDYGHYNRDSWRYNEPDGRVINLKITYSIGYGKTKQRGDMELNKNINSAIIKGF